MARAQSDTPGAKVFLSYRRADSVGWAGRLGDMLDQELATDSVFRDVPNLKAGQDYRKELLTVLAQCRVVLVLIGPRWLAGIKEEDDGDGDRNPNWLHLEIKTALERRLVVIPILLPGGRMPVDDSQLPLDVRDLMYHQAHHLTDPGFRSEVTALIDTLVQDHGFRRKSEPIPAARSVSLGQRTKRLLVFLIPAAVMYRGIIATQHSPVQPVFIIGSAALLLGALYQLVRALLTIFFR